MPRARTLVSGSWGWVPILSVLSGVSILVLSLANTLARAGSSLAEPVYWIALPLAIVPISLALLRSECPRRERVALVALCGLTLYGPAVMTSPGSFNAYDELLHLRTVEDILRTGHLFQPNPLLTVSPYYPALETTTSGVMNLSGAEAFSAGLVLVAFTRIVFSLGLFLLFEEASSSARVAGIAALVYMLNPSFVYFDGQFGYQSLALPMVPVVLYLTARWARSGDAARASIGVLIVLLLVSVIIAHHITSYALVGLLAGWSLMHFLARRIDVYRGSIVLVALLAAVGAVAWLLVVGTLTIGYLVPPLSVAVQEAIRLVTAGEGRQLFVSATGQLAPLWQRLTGFTATGILLAWLPLGIGTVLLRLRRNSLALVLVVVALAYPASLVLRLLPTGSEAAGRSFAIIFLGVAFVVAEGILLFGRIVARMMAWLRGPRPRTEGFGRWSVTATLGRAVFAVVVVVLTIGGGILGTAPATRLAGPYLVGADSRSIDAESTSAALWSRDVLGRDRRIAADRVNRLLQGSYGLEHVVFHHSEGIETWQLFVSPVVGPAEEARLRQLQLEYLLIDRRLSQSLPLIPFYYEEGEIFEGHHSEPISAETLGKWDGSSAVDRIFDSGAVQIYDVRRLSGVE